MYDRDLRVKLKMARKKKSTIQSAKKGSRSRKAQLALARKCRQIEQKATETVEEAGSTSAPEQHAEKAGSSTVSSSSSNEATASFENFLGGKTRSQYKKVAFEKISNQDQSVCDPDAARALVDLKELKKIVSRLCCQECHNTSLELKVVKEKSKGLAVFVQVFCNFCSSRRKFLVLLPSCRGKV